MPRALSKYTVREWFRLRPLVDRKNHARYQVRERIALAKHAGPVSLPRIRNRKVLITISFNDPQVIGWQIKLIAKNIPHAIHIIADNSNDFAARAAIQGICKSTGLTYVAVPGNPWGKGKPDGSRSHGYALNWAWQNIALANNSSMVAFLDHDIFPIQNTDPFRLLAAATVAGAVTTHPDGRWYLWPGFALFNLDRLTTTRLNFGKDWLDDLDTGGLNWSRLYCRLSEGQLCKANVDRLPIADNIPFEEAFFERIDDWTHECGTTSIQIEPGRQRLLIELKRRHTMKILARSGLLTDPNELNRSDSAIHSSITQ
ncbi:hypothetical protein [Mesorhizobium sp. RIZ17]|uniref:hypothetical protein n=1 Tax=Mesorhizobium sp. RIZ17 TaxID=3132743 RepID=UPI003DA8387B